MSTTPQMSQLGQQQGQPFPSTSPFDQQGGGQQMFGQQSPQGHAQQQPFAPQPFASQPFAPQSQQASGWPGVGMMPQLQQLGRQQPFHQLLQQLGQQQQPYGEPQQQNQQALQQEQQTQQQLHQLAQTVIQQAVQQVQQQALAAGVANGFVDIVQPLPGHPQQIFLRIDNQFRVLNNPTPQIHQQIQEAFAFGHQVIGVWESTSPNILRSVRIQRI